MANHFLDLGTGLLITVDELHAAETRRFGTIMQKLTRRAQKPVAFVGAGLPRLLDDLMSGDAATFLQRCHRMEVGPLDITATKQVLADTFRLGESHIAGDPLDEAAIASRGHPYLTQLIGYEIWNASRDPGQGIGAALAAQGIATARRVSAAIFVVPV